MTSSRTGRDIPAHEAPDRTSARSARIGLAFLAVPPAAWFAHLNVSYLLVPPSCRAGHHWFIAGVTALALAAMVPSALHSARAGREREPDAIESFLGSFGIWLSALFALATLLVAASSLVVGACR